MCGWLSSGAQHTELEAAGLKSDKRCSCSLSLNVPILQAFLYQINGNWGQITHRSPIVNGAIICLTSWLVSVWGHRTVGEWHVVGRTIGLAFVAVLVVDCVILRLAALDLIIIHNRNIFFFLLQ